MPRRKTINRFFAYNAILDELISVAGDSIGEHAGIESINIHALKDQVTVTINRNDSRIAVHFHPDDPYPIERNLNNG